MSFLPMPAAAALLAARKARAPAGPLPADIVPRDIAEGVAVQFALAGLVGAVPPAGFKIGATTTRMQEYLGVTHPAAGFMVRGNLHDSGATLQWSDYRGVGVECELAVRLARDLPFGPCDIDRATAAVEKLFAASEVVENRYGKPPAGDVALVGTPTLVADQFYHAAAVLGAPPADWKKIDLEAVPGRIFVNGVERANGRGADLLGHPMQALAWLAASEVARAFGGLRAGMVIMLGSVTPPIWLDGPCEVRVAFDGLPEVRFQFS
jgi:2-keto-4-pentenoate hydratase